MVMMFLWCLPAPSPVSVLYCTLKIHYEVCFIGFDCVNSSLNIFAHALR